MSSDRPRPIRTRRTLRRRSRTPRGPRETETETEESPLGHLRRRCAGGAIAAWSAYLAVIASTAAIPEALTLKQTIALEFGVGFLGVLLTLVAIVLRILTENTSFVLSVFKAASAASTANAALEAELLDGDVPKSAAVPIQRGHEIRQHRAGRHAV